MYAYAAAMGIMHTSKRIEKIMKIEILQMWVSSGKLKGESLPSFSADEAGKSLLKLYSDWRQCRLDISERALRRRLSTEGLCSHQPRK